MQSRYDDVYGAWLRDPEAFWAEAAGGIDWFKPWDKVLDASAAPLYRWFAGAETNTCHNAVDRHVAAASSSRQSWSRPGCSSAGSSSRCSTTTASGLWRDCAMAPSKSGL